MRKIADILQDKRIQVVKQGFDGMACFLAEKRYRKEQMAIIASWSGG